MRRCLYLELLEARSLLSGFRSFDGSGNNLVHPDWGQAKTQLLRLAPASYGDGANSPAGDTAPNPRLISNLVSAESEEVLNRRMLSDFIYVFGQFLDHDLGLALPSSPAQAFPIPVPAGDELFDPLGTGSKIIPLSRSAFDPATGTARGNPRQQLTHVSAFLDGSQIYGSDAVRAAALRTFVGGQLKTSAGNLLPFNTLGLDNEITRGADPTRFFLAGDVRANENVELTALQVLFLREHNRLADQLAAARPDLDDEQLYQEARRSVIAKLQVITYKEWLPALLGTDALGPYTGYKPGVNPGLANEFAHAAFRVGHSMLGDDVEFLDDRGEEIHEEIPLTEAFRNPGLVQELGIDPILKYLASDKAREIDPVMVNGVRNLLFGPPGAGGLDLAALDIQRAREHGLADYNTTRIAYGLPAAASFAEITSDVILQEKLRTLYGDVDNVELFVGGLTEDHAPGSSVGLLFHRILVDQFQRLRDGDRFWYATQFAGAELADLEGTTLADVLRRNTELSTLQDNVFIFAVTVEGRLYRDQNGDGIGQDLEPGLRGRIVRLVKESEDGQEEELAHTTTSDNGSFRFTGLDGLDGPGVYHVLFSPSADEQLTTASRAAVHITRGMAVSGLDFGAFRFSRLEGRLFEDANVDGVYTPGSEPVVGGIEVQLFRDSNANGRLEAEADELAASYKTERDGSYVIADLRPGVYFVRPARLPGWVATSPLEARLAVISDATSPQIAFGFLTDVHQVAVFTWYQELLHRRAEPEGLAYWTAVLNQGTTPAQVVLAICASLEYRVRTVQGLYRVLLRREPDPIGLGTFVAALGAGVSADQVKSVILASSEYFTNRGQGTDDGFLEALYADSLRRDVDDHGRDVFATALANGVPRAEVVALVCQSDEYYRVEVGDSYLRWLGREAETEGRLHWAILLKSGWTHEQLQAALLVSEEFLERA